MCIRDRPKRRALLLTNAQGVVDQGHVKAAAGRLSMMRNQKHVSRAEYSQAIKRIRAAGRKVGVSVQEMREAVYESPKEPTVTIDDDKAVRFTQYWWVGMGDPLYAIGSNDGIDIPRHIVVDAVSNLNADLARVQKVGRNRYQLGKGTFKRSDIHELEHMRDAFQRALGDAPEASECAPCAAAYAAKPESAQEAHVRPVPRFKLGDPVMISGTDLYGEVSFVTGYDDHLGQYRYKVVDQYNDRKTWNENSLVAMEAKGTRVVNGDAAEEETGLGKAKTNEEAAKLSEAVGGGCVAIVERTPECVPTGVRMESPRDVYDFMAPRARKLGAERFYVLLVSNQGELLGNPIEVAAGQPDRVGVDIEQIVAPMITGAAAGARGAIVCHFHPSGGQYARASAEDKRLTEDIKKSMGIACPSTAFIDHVVVAAANGKGVGSFYSFEEGKLTKVTGGQ